jgi:hypothetical protein
MTTRAADQSLKNLFAKGTAIGFAGGLAEVAVVTSYAALAGADAGGVARAIATAVHIHGGSWTAGLAVHMALAVLLGIALMAVARGTGLLDTSSNGGTVAMASLALGSVWLVNFFVVLPVLSPDFLNQLPYAVSLASKLMFGLAAASTYLALSAAGQSRRRGPVRTILLVG